MPLLSLTFEAIVLLSVLIYFACSAYKKDLRKYHAYFAVCTFLICTVVATAIEITLRKYGIKNYYGESVATAAEAFGFYLEKGIVFGSAYVLLLWVKHKTIRTVIQISFVLILSFFLARSCSMAASGYDLFADHPSCRTCPPPTSADYNELCGTSENFTGTPPAVLLFWPSVFEEFTPHLKCSAH